MQDGFSVPFTRPHLDTVKTDRTAQNEKPHPKEDAAPRDNVFLHSLPAT